MFALTLSLRPPGCPCVGGRCPPISPSTGTDALGPICQPPPFHFNESGIPSVFFLFVLDISRRCSQGKVANTGIIHDYYRDAA